ncbi:hypothetical protein [Methylophaga marina]|uniref:hypothetical protein n=1 Tax=Methylophaga marina TaxID=45495 RepID=UPI0025748E06|nr:hypothetical protein [Methylophaga marina]
MSKVKAAVAQYDIGFFAQWFEFEDKLTQWVSQAAKNGAKLLVFPEYGSMELASLFGSRFIKTWASSCIPCKIYMPTTRLYTPSWRSNLMS